MLRFLHSNSLSVHSHIKQPMPPTRQRRYYAQFNGATVPGLYGVFKVSKFPLYPSNSKANRRIKTESRVLVNSQSAVDMKRRRTKDFAWSSQVIQSVPDRVDQAASVAP